MTARQVIIADHDGNIDAVSSPRTTVDDIEFHGFAGPNGRCLVVGAPYARVCNVGFVPGGDDALNIVGDAHGTVVVNCEAMAANWTDSKALICYTGAASNEVGPVFGADTGFAAQFIGCKFQGSHFAGRLTGGVWQFIDDDIWISALSGFDFIDPCNANVIGCRFHTIAKPDAAPYWGGVPIRAYRLKNGKVAAPRSSRLFFAGNTLDGKPIEGPQLCPGAPANVFRKGPN